MARLDELTAEEALKYNYRNAPAQILDEHTNTNEYNYTILLDLLQ